MYEQVNILQEGLLGVRIKPLKAMTINLESEIGHANQPFAPVSLRNYTALNGRFEYRVKKLTLGAAYKENYNNNSVTLSSYSSHARNYSANASWAPRDWFTLDASYSKLHVDSLSGIAFFAGLAAVSPLTSNQIYISNIHAANLVARFVVSKRVDLYVGYTITLDTGDGRGSAAPPGATDPTTLIFAPVQTFPLELPGAAGARFHPPAREAALERGLAVLQLSRTVRPRILLPGLSRQHRLYQPDLGVLTCLSGSPCGHPSIAGQPPPGLRETALRA